MAKDGGRGAIPLYHQIYLALRDEIVGGVRPFGSIVPTEQELGALHGVSRITARRALDELALSGLVQRRRRVGTRVSFRAPTAPIEAQIDQAVESLIAFGRGTAVSLLDHGEMPAGDAVGAKLCIAAEASVLRALRLRSLDGAPLGAIESYVPAALAPAVQREVLTHTPMLELIRGAGHIIGAGTQTVAAGLADPDTASLLQIEARAAVLHIDRVVSEAGGRPLLYTRATYRGDRYRLTVDLHGSGA